MTSPLSHRCAWLRTAAVLALLCNLRDILADLTTTDAFPFKNGWKRENPVFVSPQRRLAQWVSTSSPITITESPENNDYLPDDVFLIRFDTENGVTDIECVISRDSGVLIASISPCISPFNMENRLNSDGEYKFEIQGYQQYTGATVTENLVFVIDRTPPITTISNSYRTSDPTVTIEFVGSDNYGISYFECNLNASIWQICISPRVVTAGIYGPLEIRVRAVDYAGNVDPNPQEVSWVIGDGSYTSQNSISVTTTSPHAESGEDETGISLDVGLRGNNTNVIVAVMAVSVPVVFIFICASVILIRKCRHQRRLKHVMKATGVTKEIEFEGASQPSFVTQI